MEYFKLLMILVASHAIGDYALQSDYIAKEKAKSFYVLFIHVNIWTFIITSVSYFIGLNINMVNVLFILWIPHLIMDYLKARNKKFKELIPNQSIQLFIDQSFHYIQLILFLLITF